jgi:hypothetical protein
MMATQDSIDRLVQDPEEFSRGDVRVVAARAERREDFEHAYLYVVLTFVGPEPGRRTWSVDGVHAVLQAVRDRAAETQVADDEDLVISYVTQPGTGDPSAFPVDRPPPGRSE